MISGRNTKLIDKTHVRVSPTLSLHLPFLLSPEVGKYLKGRTPLLELHLPVKHDGGGHDDEVGAPVVQLARQVRQQRDRLDSLTKTHLVSQDTCHQTQKEREEMIQRVSQIFVSCAEIDRNKGKYSLKVKATRVVQPPLVRGRRYHD